MSNDLDLYTPGGVQPYAPLPQPLVPTAEDNWGDVPDYLSEHQRSSAPVQLFGTPLPSGSTAQDAERAISVIAGSYMASMANWGQPANLTDAAITWFRTAATQPPRREQRRHNYDLHDQAGDPVAENFANYMARFNAPQEFISNSIYFIEELERQQNNGSGHDQAQGRAPNTSDPLDSLTDAEYEHVIKINDQAKAETMGYLKDLWGQSFQSNLRMVQEYFQNLPAREQEHLGQMTTGWVAGTNTREVLLGLYQQAIGAGSISNSGAGIADEIAAIERLMVTDRRNYMRDERLQARYRHLLTLRDG